ncbi:MAG: hypothetical protein L6V93_19165 [Clostridiales bacterium]|nr:MAG: hypothetical protein L6V93_19165 [Clostridiales bacterium]
MKFTTASTFFYQRYERGKSTCKLKEVGDTTKTGTKITFKPDYEIFEDLIYDYDILLSRLREQAFLNKGIKNYPQRQARQRQTGRFAV